MEAHMEKTETTLEMKRIFQASAARLFQAWTDPEMMDRWFHPDPRMHSECTVDCRVGGRYEIKMFGAEDKAFVVGGTYEEIVPDEKLVFTWRWLAAKSPDHMRITVEFRPVSETETELSLLHERFPNIEERDSHAQGWVGTLDQLAAALA